MFYTTNNNTDIFGLCCKAYLEGDKKAKITVRTDIAETDYLPADYLFRGFDEMPEHEKAALLEAKGKILDIGACAGSHSLYLQDKGFDVTALDISEGCCEVMQKRGIKKVVCKNIFDYNEQKFDTIFLLMNGIGMAGTLPELPKLLSHLKSLLNDGGQIVFDSSDLQYLYLEDDGSMNIPLGASIGCVFVPKEGNDFSELFKKADKALYVVKQNGKHGYNIFSESAESLDEDDSNRARLSHVEMILGERNQGEGALQIPFESFRALYRFLRRTVVIYDKPVCILLFTLDKSGDDGIPLLHAVDELYQTIQSTLRKGDAITQHGKNLILVLLINTGYPELEHAVDRIRKNWQDTPASENYTFTYEWSVLEP